MRLHPTQLCPWGVTRALLVLLRTKQAEAVLQELGALSEFLAKEQVFIYLFYVFS